MEIKIPYYEDNTRISNSAIGWYLAKGPSYLKAKLDGEIVDTPTSQMKLGTMIHMAILQPEEFNDYYYMANISKYPASDKAKQFCDKLINSTELIEFDALKKAYLETYSTYGLTQEKILQRATELAALYEDYIDALKGVNGREIVNAYERNMLSKIKNNLEEHDGWKFLKRWENADYLDSTYTAHYEAKVYKEFHINWECCGVPCKSLIDMCVFNLEKKDVFLIDLKTTSHIGEFRKSIDTYDYFRQLCFYRMALQWYIKNELNEDPKDWEFVYYIVAISTTFDNEIRVFKIKNELVDNKESIIRDVLKEIKFHTFAGHWKHRYAYYDTSNTGKGIEEINE